MDNLELIVECASIDEANDLCLQNSLVGNVDIIVIGKCLFTKKPPIRPNFKIAKTIFNLYSGQLNSGCVLNDPKTIIADNVDKLAAVAAICGLQTELAIDTETTGLNPWLDGLVGISLSWGIDKGQSAYIPIGHWIGNNIPLKTVIEYLNPIFSDVNIKKVFHNAKFDLKFLLLNGFNVDGLYFDTLVVHWLLYCHDLSKHGLKEIINKFVSKTIEVPEFKDLMKEVPKGTKHKNIGDLSPERVGYYAGLDSVNTFHCYLGLQKILNIEPKIKCLWFEVELPVLNILVKMELQGLELNKEWYLTKTVELSNEIEKINEKIKQYDSELNIGSVQQLNNYFFKVLKLPRESLAKNKVGYSLDKNAMQFLSQYHELPAIIVEYRHLVKMKSTYVDAPLEKLNQRTNKLHTEYNQAKVVTGRLASTNPNSQNFPVKYREGIIPTAGHILFAADYSGCEYRILSSLSKCKFLIEGYLNGYDAHTTVAKMIFPDKDPKEINPAWGKDYRFVGKQINFAIVYGKQPQNLATWIGIPLKTVYEYYDIYWNKLNEVKQLMDYVHKTAVASGYSETVMGRKRRYVFTDSFYTQQYGLPVEYIQLKENNQPIDAEIFRQSFNAVIQGSNADITKLAMRETTKYLTEIDSAAKLLLQIHDELVFEIPFEEVAELPKQLVRIMESVYPFEVPLKVDYRLGYNWKQIKG